MILSTKKQAQREEYSLFIDKLIDTVRTELAWSAEISYESLSVKDACEVFLLDNQNDLETFISRESGNSSEERNFDWVIRDNRLWFVSKNVEKHSIPSQEMMYRTLDYAMELERII